MIVYLLIKLFPFLYGIASADVSIEVKGMFCFFSILESFGEIVILIFYLKERFSR